jgi:hypothetical protein
MIHKADEKENKIINEMCIRILETIDKNKNSGLSAIISLITGAYQRLGHDKKRLLEDMSTSWDFYETQL